MVKKVNPVWMIDSGSFENMTPDITDFSSFKKLENPMPIVGEGGGKLQALGIGEVTLASNIHGIDRDVIFKNVLYVPAVSTRLLSTAKLGEFRFDVVFSYLLKTCIIFNDSKIPVLCFSLNQESQKFWLTESCVRFRNSDIPLLRFTPSFKWLSTPVFLASLPFFFIGLYVCIKEIFVL